MTTDITICINNFCPLALDCYRHEATPKEENQSYAEFEYDNGCVDFLKIHRLEDSKKRKINPNQRIFREQSYQKMIERKQRKHKKKEY